MLEQTRAAALRYREIEALLQTPEVSGDAKRIKELMRELKRLAPVVAEREKLTKAHGDLESAKALLASETDPDLIALAEEEIAKQTRIAYACEQTLKELLVPRDENDEKNVIVEIRGGAGGEEAALFAGVLYRMYQMYCASHGYRVEVLNENPTELGGYKEISFSISGEGAYGAFKFESGVHRVQRVPETESAGRIHTSTVTVAVLPEAQDVEVEIRDEDLEIDTHRASGAGGQHVNKTDSAIRILHKPSGIVVECQDERSQHKNREKAMRVLRSKLYEAKLKEQTDAIADQRKTQVGTGDRSERIRTYNYPQSRVTDHRIGYTAHNLDALLDGRLDELFSALREADLKARMESQNP